jgi:steroid delta-isomerase-like uncharacterized protein
MSERANAALVRRFYEEVWDRGNTAFALEVFADDYVRHDARGGEAPPGGEGQARIAADFRRAFPDLRFRVDMLLADGDLVAGCWTATGTHTGAWAGVAPTGRRVEFCGVNIFRLEVGRVVEIWNLRDDLGLLEQVGARIYAGVAPKD